MEPRVNSRAYSSTTTDTYLVLLRSSRRSGFRILENRRDSTVTVNTRIEHEDRQLCVSVEASLQFPHGSPVHRLVYRSHIVYTCWVTRFNKHGSFSKTRQAYRSRKKFPKQTPRSFVIFIIGPADWSRAIDIEARARARGAETRGDI